MIFRLLLFLGLLLYGADHSPRTLPLSNLPEFVEIQRPDNARADSVSPFAMARLINENKKVSEEAHTSKQLDLVSIWQKLGIDAGPFKFCSGDCSASVHKAELDGQPNREVIVKLTRSFNFCRFLIFSEGLSKGSEWSFRGHLDHDFNRYEMASHRVLLLRGKPWLVIRGQVGSGSGFSLYGETWYELNQQGLRQVLWYPRDGHTYPWPAGLSRDFKAEVPTGNAEQLIVNYEVRYTALNYRGRKSTKLFVNHHRACYIWDTKASSFSFSNSCSDTSEKEISAIANLESDEDKPDPTQQIGDTKFYSDPRAFVGGGYEVFLKYNFSDLMKIAKDKNHVLSEWLRLYLKECEDTPEKRTLERALVNK